MSDLGPDWISCKPLDVPKVTGVAYTRVREAIDSGELETVGTSANRKVVTRKAIEAWLDRLAERAS